MKKMIYTILFAVLAVVNLSAQDAKYIDAMKENFASIGEAKTYEDFQDISNAFQRIAQAEKKEWHPQYYASYVLLIATFVVNEPDTDKKDKMLDNSLELIETADKNFPNNSEILTLKAFILSMKIEISPMARGMKYGGQVNTLLDKAIELNKKNPRAFFLKASNLYYTPEAFGGSKVKACENIKKANELFNSEKPSSELSPNWGKEQAESVLTTFCKEQK